MISWAMPGFVTLGQAYLGVSMSSIFQTRVPSDQALCFDLARSSSGDIGVRVAMVFASLWLVWVVTRLIILPLAGCVDGLSRPRSYVFWWRYSCHWQYNKGMTDVQGTITALRQKGWTLAALADELEVDYDTVARWERGTRSPANAVGVKMALAQLMKRRRIPRRRRYTKKAHAS